MGFSLAERTSNLKHMASEHFDLVIVGGGINGAGVARDAASRGMKVALVEARDFAEGTSSRSSKLIHGGIRYLENLEFGLVFEALSERRLLFEIAPHLVHPLRFVLPLYREGRVGMFKMGLGMWLYDALSLFEAPELHERLNSHDTMERLGILRSDGLLGSFAYSDAYMDDDRLVVETIRSAHRQGACIANYVSATGVEMARGRVKRLKCKDENSGAEFQISGHHFVSTVGPWTDELGQRILPDWKKILRPSKGVHLTFHRDRLPLTDAVVMAADEDKRIVFAIPRHEMIIVGTTDTDFKEAPESVRTTDDDVEYILNVARHYFPGAALERSDILASYAGVRPLVDDGSASEGKTSREHTIIEDPRNITFVAGGKYTTYRHMAEETVDKVLKVFPFDQRMKFGPSNTKRPLNDLCKASDFLEGYVRKSELAKEFALEASDVSFLFDRHGKEALDIMKFRKDFSFVPGGDQRLIWLMEAKFAINETMCFHLKDFYFRRSPLYLARKDHGLIYLNELAEVFAENLSWDQKETLHQKKMTQDAIFSELSWQTS